VVLSHGTGVRIPVAVPIFQSEGFQLLPGFRFASALKRMAVQRVSRVCFFAFVSCAAGTAVTGVNRANGMAAAIAW
jgi:hypothetical protein